MQVKIANGKYKLANVPKPHSAFQIYVVQIAPKSGLCSIRAVGNVISTSGFGIELRFEFSKMEGKLKKVYGKHKTSDFLMTGSLWEEPQYFMMGLLKKDRVLAAFWREKEDSTFSDNIKDVTLITNALTTDRGFVAVEYSFTNEEACDSELSAKNDSSL